MGKYDIAPQKLQEEIDWLTSPTGQAKLPDKLKPEDQVDWMFNTNVVYSTQIAELYHKKGKKKKVKEILLKVQPSLRNPNIK